MTPLEVAVVSVVVCAVLGAVVADIAARDRERARVADIAARGRERARRLQLIDGWRPMVIERLREYARRLRVPVLAVAPATLRDWRTDASACGVTVRWGDQFQVLVREDCAGDPWVLAHELGHVASWQAGGASSEGEADCEAEKILLAVLTAEEREVIGPIVTGVLRSPTVRAVAAAQEAASRDLERRLGPRTMAR